MGRHYSDKKMADMHCHILPGIDDGSQSMNETIEMLKVALNEGITDMIVTPHYKIGRHNASGKTIRKLINEVSEKAAYEGISINLYPGNEVFFFSEIDEAIENNEVETLNETNRVLVEFSPSDQFRYIRNAIDKVFGADCVPVIAHVERYECMLDKPEHVRELADMGVEIQINAASITGELGHKVKKFVHNLIKDELVTYVGTDAHNDRQRAPKVAECIDLLYKKYDEEYVDAIIYENAMALIEC